jgi:phosphatidylglycerol:prolipoprotein diacylglycerol transferase
MALGLWLSAREAVRRAESPDDLLKAAEIALIGGLIGARLYYVLFNLDYYQTQPWWRIFAVWEGGLAIHGGLIAGLLTGGAYVWAKGLPLLTYLDIVAPSLALAQAIGRWGNFFNEEAFGGPTDLPWKLFISEPRRPPAYVDQQFFHPTFLYESLWNGGLPSSSISPSGDGSSGRRARCSLHTSGSTSLGRSDRGPRTDSLMLGSFRSRRS